MVQNCWYTSLSTDAALNTVQQQTLEISDCRKEEDVLRSQNGKQKSVY